MTEREFERQLQQFLRLLQKEKTCLIKNQAEKLPELVEKNRLRTRFSMYEGTLSAAIKELIRQIQVQQAENLLLTEQAISFQTVLMDAVKENIKTPANTYSKYQENKLSQQRSSIKNVRSTSMTGLFGSLGTATRGMTANQAALQTSSHNIAKYQYRRLLKTTSQLASRSVLSFSGRRQHRYGCESRQCRTDRR